jgi:hypothetical protein
LTVNGQECNACEITSWSENDFNCTGLTDFDCSNTEAGSVATKQCSTFYNPFPEITRIEAIVSGTGRLATTTTTTSWAMLGTSVLLGAVMAWGTAVLS